MIGGRSLRYSPASRRSAPTWPNFLIPLFSIVGVLTIWEVLSQLGVLDTRFVPSMSATARELGNVIQTRDFWDAVINTLKGWALGLGISLGSAIPLGIVIGSSRLLYRSVRLVIEFLRPVPSVALIPLAVLMYGTGLESKVFLAAFASFWPLFIQTLYGVQDVDPVALDTARSFGLGRFERLYRITLPGAVPYIATGVRISSAVALVLSVIAEIVLGAAGLGREINRASSVDRLELMYAFVVAVGLLGWLLNSLATRGNRRLMHWHPSHREAA